MHSELAEAPGGVDTAAARRLADELDRGTFLPGTVYTQARDTLRALAAALDAWRDLAIAETTRADAERRELDRMTILADASIAGGAGWIARAMTAEARAKAAESDRDRLRAAVTEMLQTEARWHTVFLSHPHALTAVARILAALAPRDGGGVEPVPVPDQAATP